MKLLVVTRNFWPHSSLTELAINDLVLNLFDAGHQVSVATFQWEKSWSSKVYFQDIPIIRFCRPVTGPWTSFRYARAMTRHLETHRYDGVIVSGFGDEAQAVLKSVDEFTPVVLRIDDSFVGVENQIHRKHIETCLAADAVVANSSSVADRLSRLQEMPPVQVVPPGIRHDCHSFCLNKLQIRTALSKAHPVLRIDADQPLVICGTRMNSMAGFENLIHSWPVVLRKFPGAKLWLLGDGKNIESVWQRVLERELTHSILLPGCFDDLTDVFKAGDLYVDVSGPAESAEAMVRAMAAGLAPIAIDNPTSKELIPKTTIGKRVSNSAQCLAMEMIESLLDADWRKTAGQLASESVVERFNPTDQAEKYIGLIRSFSNQLVEVAK